MRGFVPVLPGPHVGDSPAQRAACRQSEKSTFCHSDFHPDFHPTFTLILPPVVIPFRAAAFVQ
jgi:hypothetical protein